MPHPPKKTILEKTKSAAYPMNNPIAILLIGIKWKIFATQSFFFNSDDFGLRSHVHSENVSAKKCSYLYRCTRRFRCSCVG